MAEQIDLQSNLSTGLQITAPRLGRLEFVHDGREVAENPQFDIEYQLGVSRFGEMEFGVEFGASLKNVPGVHAAASFRMIVHVIPDSEASKDLEGTFRSVSCRLAPVALYPFVREAIVSAALKAHLPMLVPPIANVGTIYSPEEIAIPPVPKKPESPPDES